MIKVISKSCGHQIGWYLRNTPRTPDIALSKDFMRMDGTFPNLNEFGRKNMSLKFERG